MAIPQFIRYSSLSNTFPFLPFAYRSLKTYCLHERLIDQKNYQLAEYKSLTRVNLHINELTSIRNGNQLKIINLLPLLHRVHFNFCTKSIH